MTRTVELKKAVIGNVEFRGQNFRREPGFRDTDNVRRMKESSRNK